MSGLEFAPSFLIRMRWRAAILMILVLPPACLADRSDPGRGSIGETSAAAQRIAETVRSCAEDAQTRATDRLLCGSLGRLNVEEPLAFDEVRRWVCDVSRPADYSDAARESQTRDLFGCGLLFDGVEVEFAEDAEQDATLGLWWDDGHVVLGSLEDYPGNL
jgi:hypothetical protein